MIHTLGQILLGTCLMLAGCSRIIAERGPQLRVGARWAILPIANQGEAPRAGERTEAILSSLMRSQLRLDAAHFRDGVADPERALPDLNAEVRAQRALRWAQDGGYDYAVTGSVQEWRYRADPEGEPAVGLTLWVIDVRTGRTVWSGTGARAGLSRDTLSGTAQTLLAQLLARLEVR